MIEGLDPAVVTKAVRNQLPHRTERLVLRTFTPSDFDAVKLYQRDVDTAKYLWRPMPTDEQLRKRVAGTDTIVNDGDAIGIAITYDDTLVGETLVKITDLAGRQAEIGWIIAPAWRGRGIAMEAGQAALQLAFDAGAHRVVAILDHDNPASARIAQHIGMRREALCIEDGVNPATGEYGSSETWAILEP